MEEEKKTASQDTQYNKGFSTGILFVICVLLVISIIYSDPNKETLKNFSDNDRLFGIPIRT